MKKDYNTAIASDILDSGIKVCKLEVLQVPSEDASMTSIARREQDDSGEYSDASQDIEHNNSRNDGGQHESDYDFEGTGSEHSEGDAENQEQEHRVDDDEDRSNPQYIPKRGTFYEHDDRTAARIEETSNPSFETAAEKKEGSEAPTERRRGREGLLKSDFINKWSHDKYNENEQIPKSRDELVAIYGYDIRNEDAPPHARRNRRYGRGPNKYTRTWEDEDAYKRQNAAQTPNRKPPTAEDFPQLEATVKRHSRKPRTSRPRSKSQPTSTESSENGSQLRRNASTKTPKPKQAVKPSGNKNAPGKPAPKPQEKKMPPIENLTITTNVNNNNQDQPQRKVNAVAQQRPVPTDQGKGKKNPPTSAQTPQQNSAPPNKPQAQSQSSPQPQQKPAQQPQNQQLNQQQTASEQRGGSKRYSSLRQRPLADTYSPQPQTNQLPQPQANHQPQQQPQQQPHRYHADFPANAQSSNQHQGSPVPQMHPQQMMHQVHRNAPVNQPQHGPSPPHQPLPQQHNQQVRLGIIEPQQLVSPHPHHSLHNITPQHAMVSGQLQPTPQGYAPPSMMPAQYMPQQGNNAVFAGAPMYAQPPPAPYPHQLYQHHNYATQAGGVTYYSPVEQEQLPRAQRRPTAAIPIVRPAAPAHNDRPANSKENDNIDRIVENMFVRKPWPATPGVDAKDKSQADNRSSQEPQSKDSSQPNSLTSSSISTDSKPSETQEVDGKEDRKQETPVSEILEPPASSETIATDA